MAALARPAGALAALRQAAGLLTRSHPHAQLREACAVAAARGPLSAVAPRRLSGAWCQPQPPASRCSSSGAAAAAGQDGAAPAPTPAAGDAACSVVPPGGAAAAASEFTDLPAKLALLEQYTGVPQDQALQRFKPFLCSPAHNFGVRLAFLASRGKLRQQRPRLWEVICPSDAELCEIHQEALADLQAFKAQHLASPGWREFCAAHAVREAQPPAG